MLNCHAMNINSLPLAKIHVAIHDKVARELFSDFFLFNAIFEKIRKIEKNNNINNVNNITRDNINRDNNAN